MDATTDISHALRAAVLQLLRPLVRILLRNGIPHAAFAELAKHAYVQIAEQDFPVAGRKQTTSRISVITGLTRKEVQRLRALGEEGDTAAAERYNRAARVIGGWLRDPEFSDTRRHRPRPLPFEGDAGSFTALARRHSGDVPPRAILDELERVEAVEIDDTGRIHLRSPAYIPKGATADQLAILGSDVRDLISTIDHNLHEDGVAFFQRKVAYDNLPAEAVQAFRPLAGEQGQALLERLDAWLGAHDRDTAPATPGSGRYRAGLSIYYFEEQLGETPQEEQAS